VAFIFYFVLHTIRKSYNRISHWDVKVNLIFANNLC